MNADSGVDMSTVVPEAAPASVLRNYTFDELKLGDSASFTRTVIQPTLEHMRDICQNAIELVHTLGVNNPLVGVLAAVETVNPRMPATLDAAALTVMAALGQINGAKVDGPFAFADR
jgi:hypothetical protein